MAYIQLIPKKSHTHNMDLYCCSVCREPINLEAWNVQEDSNCPECGNKLEYLERKIRNQTMKIFPKGRPKHYNKIGISNVSK